MCAWWRFRYNWGKRRRDSQASVRGQEQWLTGYVRIADGAGKSTILTGVMGVADVI